MTPTLKRHPLFQRHLFLPNEHGAWVFLLSPLAIGLFASGHWSIALAPLIIAALAAFLGRQPVTIAIKALSGRRPRHELPLAGFWILIYGAIGLAATGLLIALGFGFLLYLALPALPVFAWHLYLVSRRAERRQMGVEVVASGTLALAAPAALWVQRNYADPQGWWLWALCWMQSAASIVYAYLRLQQREMTEPGDLMNGLRLARRALLYTTFNVVAVVAASLVGLSPPLLFVPYALQWAETLWGTFHPAVGVRPTVIGLRQLAVSTLFTLLFIIAWRLT
jgi:hypothetical protein